MKTPKLFVFAFGLLLLLTPVAWAQTLGTSNLLEGNPAGSDSVVLAANGAWTATTNPVWLHLSTDNQSGAGSTNVIFTFDANPGATRTGTLTIAGQTLTVTQAGSTYVAANPATPLVSSGLGSPVGVAVDGAGNVYIADTGNNAVEEWIAASNTVTTLVSTGLAQPRGVAVDSAGNVYIADTGNSRVKEWVSASNTVVSLRIPSYEPNGVAVDGVGNVYVADTGDQVIRKWIAASNTYTTPVSSGLSNPLGVALDCAGNVYIADIDPNAILEWVAASNTVATLVPSGFFSYGFPVSVAVDGGGNVYFAHGDGDAIQEWIAASNTVTTVWNGIPLGVAVDGAGNVYFGYNFGINELPHAFVDPTGKLEGLAAGNDNLPVVLPATANLTGPFAPVSDSAWLTITWVTNGVVSFGFAANPGSARTAHITLLGQTISITQGLIGTPPNLTGVQTPGNGVIQFSFTNNPSASFTVLTATNISLPLAQWTVVGSAMNIFPSNLFQFTPQPTTNNQQRYYTVHSP